MSKAHCPWQGCADECIEYISGGDEMSGNSHCDGDLAKHFGASSRSLTYACGQDARSPSGGRVTCANEIEVKWPQGHDVRLSPVEFRQGWFS